MSDVNATTLYKTCGAYFGCKVFYESFFMGSRDRREESA